MNARQWPEGFTPAYRVPEPPMPETTLTTRELFRVLRDRVGTDLATVLDRAEAIYDADGEAHFSAAYQLAKAAEDACADWDIE
jgi:hypothetical protein